MRPRLLCCALLALLMPALAAAQTPIHDVQGSGGVSPLVGQAVIVQGIVTGLRSNGFFIQTPDAQVDANPATSEAILVFTSSAPPPAAAVGNRVQVVGTVVEFIPSQDPLAPSITELTTPSVSVLSTGNALPAAVTLTTFQPWPALGHDQLEPFECMRVSVPRLTVVGPTQGNISESSATATSTGVFFGVVEGNARPFREPGIQSPDPPPAGTGSIPPIPRWDFDPELLRVDSDGLVGSPALNVASGAVVTGLIGPLDFVNRRYTILPQSGAVVESDTRQPLAVPVVLSSQYTIANLNANRLYDAVASPGSPVTLTAGAFSQRLGKLSRLVRDVMRSPDIIAVQDVEDLSTLQALASRISSDAVLAGQPDPVYVGFLVEGTSVIALDNGLLVKTALDGGQPRVSVTSVTQLFASTLLVSPLGVQSLLFDRPPLELQCTVRTSNGQTQPVTVIACQLLSPTSVALETADLDWGTLGNKARTQRYRQAATIANRLQTLQTTGPDPSRGIVVMGEFFTPEFNDGFGDLLGVLRGSPVPDNQTVTSADGADLVTPDFTDLTAPVSAVERYQTVLNGVAQASQHMLLSRSLMLNTTARSLSYARACADFPETARNTAGTATRALDTDPLVAYLTPGSALDVTPATGLAFGVRSVSPNPAAGAIRVRFAIEAGANARLELFDLAGRRVESHTIEPVAAAEQSRTLAEGRVLQPGVYQVRLTQGARSHTSRVLVVH